MKKILLTIANLGVTFKALKVEEEVLLQFSKRIEEDNGSFKTEMIQRRYDISVLERITSEIVDSCLIEGIVKELNVKFKNHK